MNYATWYLLVDDVENLLLFLYHLVLWKVIISFTVISLQASILPALFTYLLVQWLAHSRCSDVELMNEFFLIIYLFIYLWPHRVACGILVP